MAEKPVECSHCKKPVKIVYKEIMDNTVTRTEMCADCPIFQQKFYRQSAGQMIEAAEASLCCGNCQTTLESVKTGNPLGCIECYSVFGDILITELIAANKISTRLQKGLKMKKNQPIHVGTSPNQPADITLSARLKTLNEALNEALKKENYEQAAWLRDQIKALTDKPNARKE